MRELNRLFQSDEIALAAQATLSAFYKSACQQHSCAKVSHSFFEGIQERAPANLGASFRRSGLKQKKECTYEAASAMIIGFASSHLSLNYAHTVSVEVN